MELNFHHRQCSQRKRDIGWDYVTGTGITANPFRAAMFDATGNFERNINVNGLTMLLGESDFMQKVERLEDARSLPFGPYAYEATAFATTTMGVDIVVGASGNFHVSHTSSLSQLKLIVNRLYRMILRMDVAVNTTLPVIQERDEEEEEEETQEPITVIT